jgi:uncharacterized protein (DUF983 family)
MQPPPQPDPGFERWPPERKPAKLPWNMPDWPQTIARGIRGRCPSCNAAPIFDGYLKVYEKCRNCGAPLGDMPADDAPPYIAMLVVLHILALFIVLFYKGVFRPGFIMSGVLLLLLALLCMVALRMAKGAVIGILLKLGMRRERVS